MWIIRGRRGQGEDKEDSLVKAVKRKEVKPNFKR